MGHSCRMFCCDSSHCIKHCMWNVCPHCPQTGGQSSPGYFTLGQQASNGIRQIPQTYNVQTRMRIYSLQFFRLFKMLTSSSISHFQMATPWYLLIFTFMSLTHWSQQLILNDEWWMKKITKLICLFENDASNTLFGGQNNQLPTYWNTSFFLQDFLTFSLLSPQSYHIDRSYRIALYCIALFLWLQIERRKKRTTTTIDRKRVLVKFFISIYLQNSSIGII